MQGDSIPLHNSQANHSGCSCHTIRGGTGNNTEVKGPLWQLTIRFPCTHSDTSLSLTVCLLCLIWPCREQDLGHFKGGFSRRKTAENKTQSDSLFLNCQESGAYPTVYSKHVRKRWELKFTVSPALPHRSWLPTLATELRRMAAAQEKIKLPLLPQLCRSQSSCSPLFQAAYALQLHKADRRCYCQMSLNECLRALWWWKRFLFL